MSAALHLALAALSALPLPGRDPAPAQPTSVIATWLRAQGGQDRPRISVWVNRDDPYERGDNARVYFKADRDAYVTVIRIDTDGRMRVLFPIDPWEDNFARGGKTFEVLGRDRDEAFNVDDYPGVGYIFAIASGDEFRYDDIVRGDHWDYRSVSDGRVRGDPYVAVSDLAEKIATEDDYDYDVASYDVERHYDYPRFVCYDCHTYASWRYWDPYSSYCSRFQIVIYDDWYYYPYRRYRGVYTGRPYRPGPRYVFKDSDPRNDYVTRVAKRPRYDEPVRRTSADVGGRGSIPAPVSPRRRADDAPRGASPGSSPSSEPRRRTDDGSRPPEIRPDNGGRPDNGRPGNNGEPRRRPTGNGNRPDNAGGDQPAPGAGAPRESDRLREDRPETRTLDDQGREQPRRDQSGGETYGSERRGRRAVERSDNPPAVERQDRGSTDRSQPRSEPRSQPRNEPRSEPRNEPRSQPRAEPRSEPRSAPRAEPRQSPPPERRAEPRSSGGGSNGGGPELRRRKP